MYSNIGIESLKCIISIRKAGFSTASETKAGVCLGSYRDLLRP